MRIRWCERRRMRLENTCETVTFTEQNRAVRAPRALLGVRTIRWATRQLRFERATIVGLARQLGSTWNTVWSHIQSVLTAVVDDPSRFAGVRVLGGDARVAPPGAAPQGTQGGHRHHGLDPGRGPSHGPLVGSGARPVRRGLPQLAGRARRAVPLRGTIATLDPFQGVRKRHR